MDADRARAALRRRECVLLCGAGISVAPPSTLPDWKALRDETVKAVAGDDPLLVPLVPKLTERELISVPGSRGLAPEVAASEISAVTAGYFQALTALGGTEPNDNHVVIARAARQGFLRHVVSTNWDTLIEAALTRADVPFRVFRTNEEFAACEVDAEPPMVQIYKIHGCLTRPDSITARVEDEARGLPESKAEVLRGLLDRFVLLVWGYSGQDLKIDLDYLQMVSCLPSALGFLWSLHATSTYRETANRYVVELASRYGERGGTAHNLLPELLNAELPAAERIAPVTVSSEEVAALRATRTVELRASLASWSATYLDEFARLEAMARLLERAGELPDAVACYERLGAMAQKAEGGNAYRVARASAQAMRVYAAIGETDAAEQLFRLVDEIGRSHGDLRLVADAGLVLAELMRRSGQFLPALKAFGYGRILLAGADEPSDELALEYDLGIGDTFADVGNFELALERYATAEASARREGRLAMVAGVLARRSWINELRDDFDAALTSLRDADEIARSLGLRREHAVWSLRIWNLEGNVRTLRGEDVPPSEIAASLNELPERAVAYAKDAGDPLLMMQASLNAAIKRGVPLPLPEIERADAGLDEIESFARASRNQQLQLQVAAQRAWIRSGLQDHAGTLEAIQTALDLLVSVGDDGLASSLLDLQGSALMQMDAPAQDLLDCCERIAARERRRGRMYPQLEATLVQLRRALEVGRYPADWAAFRQALAGHDPSTDQFLDEVARIHRFPDWEAWGESLEQSTDADSRYPIALNALASTCREARLAKQADLTIGPLEAIVAVARSWSDHQLAAITTNERGLALMTLGRASDALACFEAAAELALLGKDDAEQLDDWFNAAGACEVLQRLDDAVALYERIQQHPRVRRDPALALETSLRYGELTKAGGRADLALTHFEAAEPLARAMNRSDRMLQLVQRLGKVHFELGNHEASIRYRLEAAAIMEAGERPDGAASMLWLVANTYLTKLGQPRDALPYYERTIELYAQANAAQLAEVQPHRDRCAELAQAAAAEPRRLYDLVGEEYPVSADRDRVLLRLAAGMAFNVWRFEPQSFAAYCEGAPHIKLPPPGGQGEPIRFPHRLPMCLETLAGAARFETQKGHAEAAAKLLRLRERLAANWSLPVDPNG